MSDSKGMAEIFNTFFSSVFTREDTGNVPEPQHQHAGAELRDVQVNVRKVREKIKRLRKRAAAGPDSIGPMLLQELVEEVAYPLALVMKKTLEDGSMPEDWRTANVTPIFNKGAKNNPGNYRPVSLTSVCCKMLESIIKDDIVNHLEKKPSLTRPSMAS